MICVKFPSLTQSLREPLSKIRPDLGAVPYLPRTSSKLCTVDRQFAVQTGNQQKALALLNPNDQPGSAVEPDQRSRETAAAPKPDILLADPVAGRKRNRASSPVTADNELVMTFSSYSGAVAALGTVHFFAPALATEISSGVGDLEQQRLLSNDCLLGPFRYDSIPACVTSASVDDADSWTPWSYQPYCPDNTNYCVFTSAEFQGPDRGVSIIDVQPSRSNNTTSAAASLAQFLSSALARKAAQRTSPPYEVRDIPSKGKGLVATRKISRGQVLMVDHAAVVADERFPTRVRREHGRQLLLEAIERLPMAQEVLSLARSSSDPDNVPAVEDVMKTNSFSVEIGGRAYMALFPRIARINHACKPSALTHFNATTLSNTVTAFHDILPGDEITISYTPFALPSHPRRTLLLQKWGFPCTCALCTLPPALLAESDARRELVNRMGKEVVALAERGTTQDLKTAVGLYRKVVQAVEEEGLVPHMGGHWEVLGRLLVASGEVKEGKGWLERAGEEGRGWGGEGGVVGGW